MSEWQDFQHYKRQAVKAARDLCYTKETIEKIKEAKTLSEVDTIMRKARKNSIFLKDNWER